MSGDTAEGNIAPVRRWLIERVAYYVEMSPEDIDPAVRLTRYGMSSIYALSFCGDIEERYDIEVDATLAWDYPTVEAVAGYVMTLLDRSTEDTEEPPETTH